MKLLMIACGCALIVGLLLAYAALSLSHVPTASDRIWRCQTDLQC